MAEYVINGVNLDTNSLIVTLPTGASVSLSLATYDTKVKVINQLKALSVASKPVVPPAILALVGKKFDDNGNQIP